MQDCLQRTCTLLMPSMTSTSRPRSRSSCSEYSRLGASTGRLIRYALVGGCGWRPHSCLRRQKASQACTRQMRLKSCEWSHQTPGQGFLALSRRPCSFTLLQKDTHCLDNTAAAVRAGSRRLLPPLKEGLRCRRMPGSAQERSTGLFCFQVSFLCGYEAVEVTWVSWSDQDSGAGSAAPQLMHSRLGLQISPSFGGAQLLFFSPSCPFIRDCTVQPRAFWQVFANAHSLGDGFLRLFCSLQWPLCLVSCSPTPAASLSASAVLPLSGAAASSAQIIWQETVPGGAVFERPSLHLPAWLAVALTLVWRLCALLWCPHEVQLSASQMPGRRATLPAQLLAPAPSTSSSWPLFCTIPCTCRCSFASARAAA